MLDSIINHPVTFHRDFSNDRISTKNAIFKKVQNIALATFPLLSLCSTLRTPLTLGMSVYRSFSHFQASLSCIKEKNFSKTSFHLLITTLSTLAIALTILNPVFSSIFSTEGDLVFHIQAVLENLRNNHIKEVLENLAWILLDGLFLATIFYGSIEITVAFVLLQIVSDLYFSFDHFKKGETFEGICSFILGSARLYQALPQMKLLRWKMQYEQEFQGIVKQDPNGFVYLDLPDDMVYSLFSNFNIEGANLPPYFQKGRAGAHISIILRGEMQDHIGSVEEIGTIIPFRISQVQSVSPDGMQGVEKVWFLTVNSSELASVRTKNGFSPRIEGHDFHITFALR
ncbi:MAG: hypothetical protein JW769_05490 [Parachlamydiales bacterium]|nr:hypothetical protein [Parachlamydiales bacterium]